MRETSSESTTGNIGCFVVLNLCSYARVTPSFVNSGIIHFIWDQSRKPGPNQILPYGNGSETTSSRWFLSSHHTAMEMQQVRAVATTQMLHQRHELWPLWKKKKKKRNGGKKKRKRKPIQTEKNPNPLMKTKAQGKG